MTDNSKPASPLVTKVTALLPVSSIEPSAAFFATVGFQVMVRVPEQGPMGFAILSNGSQELMLQNFASIHEDDPAFTIVSDKAPSVLFIEVSDIEAVEKAISQYQLLMPRRQTFYGALEITVREPGGHLVTFAQFKQPDTEP